VDEWTALSAHLRVGARGGAVAVAAIGRKEAGEGDRLNVKWGSGVEQRTDRRSPESISHP
jgi:hypothetical protein